MALNQMTYHQPNQGGGGAPPAPKPPPRKNPYRDGISKSSQNYDVFEAIRHPNRSLSNRPPIAPSRESLSKQKKLQNQLYEEFKQNNYQLPGGHFNLIGKVLKMLFLAITLPIYLILYRLPKWFFKDFLFGILKRINNYVTAFERKVVDYTKKLFKKIQYPFIRLWEQLKWLAKKNDSPQQALEPHETGFFAFIAMGLWIMIKPLYRSVLWSYRTTKKTIAFIRSLPKRWQDFIQNIQGKIEKVKAVFGKVKKGIRNLTSPAWIKASINNYVKVKEAALQEQHRRMKQWLLKHKKLIQKSFNQRVVEPIQRVKSFSQQLWKKSISYVESYYLPMKAVMLKKTGQVREWGKKVKGLWNFHDKIKAISFLKRIKSLRERMHRRAQIFMAKQHKSYAELRLKLSQPMLQWVDNHKTWIKKIDLYVHPVKRLSKHVSQNLQSWFHHYKQQAKANLVIFRPAIDLAKELSRFVKGGLEFVKDRVGERLEPVLLFCQLSLGYCEMKARIAFAWTNILLQYGMTLVAKTAHDIGWF
jgi:hypothetical protein